MNNFNSNFPTQIIFGKNRIEDLGNQIKTYKNILLVYGAGSIKKSGIYDKVIGVFQENDIAHCEVAGVKPNPDISSVREGVACCKENKIDFILAVGGGSVIDCAKAIAAGACYDGDPWDFFIGKAKITNALPLGCILTLAASASEMNGNSVVNDDQNKEKRAVGSPLLRPVFSILDPTYTFSVNKYHTAAGIVDTIAHLFCPYFYPNRFVFMQDRCAEALMKTCVHCGRIAIDDPGDYNARANLMWASSWAFNGFLKLGQANDSICHGIEHVFSGLYDITHGVGLAIILPAWMRHVLDNDNASKFAEYARNVWDVTNNDDYLAAQEGIEKTETFFKEIGMPLSFKDINIRDDDFEKIAEQLAGENGIGKFKKLFKEDILNILHLANK
jgi:alcohol dehydrogenase YqhD (iron-dependent ADH family)